MSEASVVSLFGGPTGIPKVNEACVDLLREWLQMAEAGEVQGVAIAGYCADGLARRAIDGTFGGYSIIGAAQVNVAALVNHIAESEE